MDILDLGCGCGVLGLSIGLHTGKMFIQSIQSRDISPEAVELTKQNIETETFEVYDVFKKDFVGPFMLSSDIKNFHITKKGSVVCELDMNKQVLADEDFVPILFGENRYTEILGFKAKKI